MVGHKKKKRKQMDKQKENKNKPVRIQGEQRPDDGKPLWPEVQKYTQHRAGCHLSCVTKLAKKKSLYVQHIRLKEQTCTAQRPYSILFFSSVAVSLCLFIH